MYLACLRCTMREHVINFTVVRFGTTTWPELAWRPDCLQKTHLSFQSLRLHLSILRLPLNKDCHQSRLRSLDSVDAWSRFECLLFDKGGAMFASMKYDNCQTGNRARLVGLSPHDREGGDGKWRWHLDPRDGCGLFSKVY